MRYRKELVLPKGFLKLQESCLLCTYAFIEDNAYSQATQVFTHAEVRRTIDLRERPTRLTLPATAPATQLHRLVHTIAYFSILFDILYSSYNRPV